MPVSLLFIWKMISFNEILFQVLAIKINSVDMIKIILINTYSVIFLNMSFLRSVYLDRKCISYCLVKNFVTNLAM